MTEEFEDEVKKFDYCDKVDLHALDHNIQIEKVVVIASEHGFRGVVVPHIYLESLVKAIKSNGNQELLPICAVDYPFGSSSLDVRNYSIMSAKEKGAKEVEVVAPYHLIANNDFKHVYDDAQNIISTAKKANVGIKYVLDQNGPFIDDAVRSKLARLISSTRMPVVSTSLGYFESKVDHADSIIKMRTMKSKSGASMKVYISSQNVEDIASYVKAGADIIGLPWNKAVYLIHEYEDLVQKKD